MAIECLERALEFFGPPLYVYHEIVHNKFVVERFRRAARCSSNRSTKFPKAPRSSTVLTGFLRKSAPGPRAPAHAIDATCPLVIKVHLEAVRYAKEGYTIVLIGHEGHDEVIGTMGEAPNQMILVETAEDVERLEVPDPDKVAYLTQTTLSVDDANVVIAALRKKFPRIANPPKDDICYATQNRQEAVRELAAQADLVLVLGSQNSSNSRRLAEIADRSGSPRSSSMASRRSTSVVRGRRDRAHHGRGQRTRTGRPGVHRVSRKAFRRGDPGADGPRRERPLSPAEVTPRAAPCRCPRLPRRRESGRGRILAGGIRLKAIPPVDPRSGRRSRGR